MPAMPIHGSVSFGELRMAPARGKGWRARPLVSWPRAKRGAGETAQRDKG